MKEKVITKIINEMLPSLNNEQLKKLKDVLEVNLYNVSIVTMEEESEQETLDYLEVFLSAKRIEGCSEKTLTYYKNTIHQMMEDIGWMLQSPHLHPRAASLTRRFGYSCSDVLTPQGRHCPTPCPTHGACAL